jgi:hypothetical protein
VPAGRLLLGRRILVFHAVMLTWLVFRCDSLAVLGRYLGALFHSGPPIVLTNAMLWAVVLILFGWCCQLVTEFRDPIERFLALPPFWQGALYAFAAILIMAFNFGGSVPFIYFQF